VHGCQINHGRNAIGLSAITHTPSGTGVRSRKINDIKTQGREGDVFKEESMVHAMHLELLFAKYALMCFEGGDLRMSWAYKSFLY
jgi:hypothetical protein